MADQSASILHHGFLKDLGREVDFNILTFAGFYSILYAFLIIFLSYKFIFGPDAEKEELKMYVVLVNSLVKGRWACSARI